MILKADTPVGQLISQSAYIASKDVVNQDFDGTCSLLGCMCPEFRYRGPWACRSCIPSVPSRTRSSRRKCVSRERRGDNSTTWRDFTTTSIRWACTRTPMLWWTSSRVSTTIRGRCSVTWTRHAADALSASAGLRYLYEQANFHTQFFRDTSADSSHHAGHCGSPRLGQCANALRSELAGDGETICSTRRAHKVSGLAVTPCAARRPKQFPVSPTLIRRTQTRTSCRLPPKRSRLGKSGRERVCRQSHSVQRRPLSEPDQRLRTGQYSL